MQGLLIDANPEMIQEAAWHVKANKLDRVIPVLGLAGAAHPGQTVDFYLLPSNLGSSQFPVYEPGKPQKGAWKKISVPCLDVETLWLEHFGNVRCNLLKIDIEGSEKTFLQTDKRFLRAGGLDHFGVAQVDRQPAGDRSPAGRAGLSAGRGAGGTASDRHCLVPAEMSCVQGRSCGSILGLYIMWEMRRERVTMYYSGSVQGVGFRYAVRMLVNGFEVTGTVRNLADGRVELVAEGAGPNWRGCWRRSGSRTLAVLSGGNRRIGRRQEMNFGVLKLRNNAGTGKR